MEKYLRRLYGIIRKPELLVLPGQISFFMVLSIVPLIALVGFICSLFSISIGGLIALISQTIPEEVTNILMPAFTNPGFKIGFSTIVGLVIASNAAHSIIVASNLLFKIENAGYFKRRLKAFIMLLILLSLFFFIIVVLGFGNLILKSLLSLEVFTGISEKFYTIFVLLKWPIAIIIVFVIIKLLYTMALDKNIPSKYMNKGALFTTFCWVLITAIYSYYVGHFANYSKFYGNLANITILMIWIYLLSYILVIGIAINSDNYTMTKNQ